MIGAFIIVRLSSSRLPKKAMMEILDIPMLELMVERVRVSNLVDKVVIATSTEPSDDLLEDLAKKLEIGCYRGSLENVMDRVNNAAKEHGCDTIIELLGDNPLIHSDLIDDVVGLYQNGAYDYAATVTKEYPVLEANSEMRLFSIGVRVQVYSRKVAERYIDYPEYMKDEEKSTTAYIFEHPEVFKVGYLEAKDRWYFMNRPDLTFAVNYRKNFDLVREIFERNDPINKYFPMESVYDQLDKEKFLYLMMGNE